MNTFGYILVLIFGVTTGLVVSNSIRISKNLSKIEEQIERTDMILDSYENGKVTTESIENE